jgi:hypothetical protein
MPREPALARVTPSRLGYFVAEGFATGLAMVDMRPTGECPEQHETLRETHDLWHGAMLRWFGVHELESAP